ncbi:MAG: glycosyl transferase, WecB/TagA/CpsF family [Frankiales bacterium]|nr:glycosyl transferase, WecB/TagA/CpsF family [Frankiales bacterium]
MIPRVSVEPAAAHFHVHPTGLRPHGLPRSPDPCPPPPVPIAGIDVHPMTLCSAADQIVAWAVQGAAAVVVTPNVDHLVLLERNAGFRGAYATSRLRVCDGVPLLMLLRLCGKPVPERVNGTDLFNEVCRRAAEEHLSVFLAGGLPHVLEAALTLLPQRFPGLRVMGHSPPFGFESTADDRALRDTIRVFDPDIVMVCFGAPRSEVWAAGQVRRRPGVYLCVGSAVDFAAQMRRRAPRWMQRTGLEWLYRLVQEPRRLWRRYLVQDLAFLFIAARELARTRPARWTRTRVQPR